MCETIKIREKMLTRLWGTYWSIVSYRTCVTFYRLSNLCVCDGVRRTALISTSRPYPVIS